LEGFARLKLNTSTIRTDWFSLNSVIRADSGNFNVYNPKNEKGDALYFGIMRGFYDSVGVYPSIFAAASNPNDQIVFRPEGFLQYNPNVNEVVYGNTAKLNGTTKRGDFLKFNDATNKLYCEGKFNFGLNYAPIKLATVGNCYVDLNKNAMVYNLCIGLKIDVTKELMDLMIKDWIDLTADKQEADYKSPWIGNALAELISDKELKKAMKTIEEEAEVQKLELPKDLPYNIFLTNVRMAYDPFANSFKAVGNVSLVNLGGQYFGKQVYAYIEFGMKKGGDYFNILFETSEADWYYFNYTNHVLQTLSSNDTYTSYIQTITPEKRTIKDATNPAIYYINQQASEVKKRQFKERMRSFRY